MERAACDLHQTAQWSTVQVDAIQEVRGTGITPNLRILRTFVYRAHAVEDGPCAGIHHQVGWPPGQSHLNPNEPRQKIVANAASSGLRGDEPCRAVLRTRAWDRNLRQFTLHLGQEFTSIHSPKRRTGQDSSLDAIALGWPHKQTRPSLVRRSFAPPRRTQRRARFREWFPPSGGRSRPSARSGPGPVPWGGASPSRQCQHLLRLIEVRHGTKWYRYCGRTINPILLRNPMRY